MSEVLAVSDHLDKNVNDGPRPKATGSAPQTKTVRLSADIDPDLYRELATWCQDVAFQLGRTRVQHVWAIRALLYELLENHALEAKIIDRIQEQLAD